MAGADAAGVAGEPVRVVGFTGSQFVQGAVWFLTRQEDPVVDRVLVIVEVDDEICGRLGTRVGDGSFYDKNLRRLLTDAAGVVVI